MHELSIAQSIVDIANMHLKKEKATNVLELIIEVGCLSGVEFQALQFALEVVQKKSVLRNAKLILKKVMGKSKCNKCETIFPIDKMYDNCPKCSSFFHTILEGKELKISSMVID